MRAHPLLADTALAVLLTGFLLVAASAAVREVPEPGVRAPDGLWVLLLCVEQMSVAARRRWPVPALVLCGAAVAAYVALGYPPGLPSGTALGVLAYSLAVHAPLRTVAGSLLLTVPIGLAIVLPAGGVGPTGVLQVVIVLGAAYGLGLLVRSRNERTAELARVAAELADTREALVRAATAQERVRIARELHDVVAHHVGYIVLEAGAGRRVGAAHPERARESLERIESTGRAGLGELRQILGLLRTDAPGGPHPARGLRDVPDLVEEARRAGADVVLHVEEPLPELPAGRALAAYRVVQEALANVVRHAGPCRVEVRIARHGDGVRLSVVDDGRGATTPSRPGHGLTGMRERVALHGGTVEAGPRPGGGFAVVAVLPGEAR